MTTPAPHQRFGLTNTEVIRSRDVFWRNVMREILTSLSIACLARRDGRKMEGADLFDGRLGILTHVGERIPIADVYPMFACGIPNGKRSRSLASAVECSVFQIKTPGGEVFTLPLQEMRGFHSVSAELVEQLQAQARERLTGGESEEPFGFAAFTSLARGAEDEEGSDE